MSSSPRPLPRILRVCAAGAMLGATGALWAEVTPGAVAPQVEAAPPRGDRLGGFVLPVEPGNWDALFRATRAYTWKVDSTQRLYLEGQVNVQLGPYDFYAERAVAWVERIPSAQGVITQIAVWFPQTSEPTKAAGLGASGSNLLITASTLGQTTLRAVLHEPSAPADNTTLQAGQARLQQYLQGLLERTPVLRPLPQVQRHVPPPPLPPLEVGGSIRAAPQDSALQGGGSAPHHGDSADPLSAGAPSDADAREGRTPIIAPQSRVVFVADTVAIDTNKDTITLTGGLTLDVLPRNPGTEQRMLQLRAERGVIFLKPGTTESLRGGAGDQLNSDAVLGVYLEGDVAATDFDYTVRARRAYYDFAGERATLVEGVLRTVDRDTGLPLVARAQELQQFSQEQWQADKVRVSTSDFFTPHLSIGAERAVITRTLDDQGQGKTYLQGKNILFRTGDTPLFWAPGYEGSGEDIPLRGLGFGISGDYGLRVRTGWDLLTLLGMERTPRRDLTLYSDVWTNWGAGGGVKGHLEGVHFDLFGLYDFGNVERTSAGVNLRSPSDFRGVANGRTTLDFTPDIRMQVQGSYVSDESFMQVYRPLEFSNSVQRETSMYLVGAGENSELSLLLGYPTNNVITSSNQLAARPYQVAKYPEGAYKRWGDKLFDLVTWHQEYSANLMAIRFGEGSQSTTGVRRNTFNLLNQMLPDGNIFTNATTLKELYQGSGYQDDTYTRLYTRQELSVPLGSGGFNFTPFGSAAVSGYVNGNPGSYNARADRLRGLLAFGVRSSVDVMANYDSVEIPLLDVHRLRHVVTPYVNGWYGWDSAPEDAYAIYDQDIEGATGGAVVQVGVRQRFQTMRGGSGNWQSVDWLVLDAGVTWNDGSDGFARTYTDGARYRQSPFPQYFAWRPELSQWGRTAYGSFKWAASNTLTFHGNLTYLLDSDLPNFGAGPFGLANAARGSIGARMQHSRDVSTFLEYRAINNNAPTTIYESDQLLAGGLAYQVSRTYALSFTPTYDLQRNDFRSFTLTLTREMPDFTLMGSFGYDVIVGEYSGGLAIRIGGVNAPNISAMPFTP